ncbi:ligand-binding sensor domain-containing diguanylate cyclase [Pseudoxanthomonas suwonensis]|uniref:diguanylate cyclase n=1 Tax=Pseudoxanthomonas suwonensis TaxID=314722 RepID=A0A0E3Z243_9GAMM|nr:ligand-binding sensor domain-containing diguanylate cyclase [Pseudoxanthomonas suwonensis]AKC87523.1 histidine kinase [Pseudoxanthomonas suwonensis]
MSEPEPRRRGWRDAWRHPGRAPLAGLLLVLALAAGAAPAVAQAPQALGTQGRPPADGPGQAPPLRDYAIDAWTTRNGLPHNSLRDIAQTPDGYLWFATWEGVVRYNGVAFTVFDRGSEPGLRDNGVGALYVDPRGRLWLSDSRGNLGRLEADGRWAFVERTPQWPQALVHDMAMDGQGRMWLLFEGHGLGRVHPDGHFEYFDPPAGIPLRASFPHMAVDARDRVWIGTLDGLVMRDAEGAWHRFGAESALPPGLVWPYLAPDGTVWLAADGQLFRVDGERIVAAHALAGSGHITTLLADRRGALWVGTENRGVARIGPRGVEWLPPGEVLPRGRIASLLEDAEGSLWVGANGGLFRLRETLFTGYTRRDGLASDYVRAVFEDRDGVLWVGNGGGLDRREADGRFRPVPLPGAGAEAPSVLSIAQDADGDLWVGTFADGVYRLRDGVLRRHYAQADGVPSGHVRAIGVTADGTVWISSRRGVVRIVADGVQPPPPVPGLPQGLVTALAGIGDDLWIGSVEGASVLRGDRVERLDLDAAGGGARTVFGFQPVGDAVWIATDRGLYRYRDGRVSRVGLEQGLPVDAVFQLVPDRQGEAWIISNRGVVRVALEALRAVADGRSSRLAQVRRHTEIDGLPSAQGNGSSAPPAILRGDGTLWLATAAGVASADPARLPRYLERPPPPAVIESVQRDGQAVDWTAQHALAGGGRITVAYAGLSYLLPERIRYRTRLLGLDGDWVERGTQRNVEFVGLPPGEYTLEVAAAHPGGDWSAQPARWRFSVRPLWWQRVDVRLVATLAVLLALFTAYRWRLRRYHARNRRLERRVRERTADLQAQAERLVAADRERTELLERLREQAEAYGRQAREDALTGLPNRRHFDEVLARDLALVRRGGHPLCLAMLDIDHFKRINDSWSHGVGDQVLREAAQVLAAEVRACDLLARLGGEEFGLLMPDTMPEEARRVCERLHAHFRAREGWAGIDGLRVTFSLGLVACRPTDTPASLVERVDAALYRAKHEGRDRLELG